MPSFSVFFSQWWLSAPDCASVLIRRPSTARVGASSTRSQNMFQLPCFKSEREHSGIVRVTPAVDSQITVALHSNVRLGEAGVVNGSVQV